MDYEIVHKTNTDTHTQTKNMQDACRIAGMDAIYLKQRKHNKKQN